MRFYQKTISDVPHGLKMIQLAAEQADTPVLASDSGRAWPGHAVEINGASVQSELIQIAGRLCERYTSDLICTLSSLDPFLTICADELSDNRWYIGVGIRDSGIDHDAFIRSRLKDTVRPPYDFVHVQQAYRKLLVLEIIDKVDDGSLLRTINLKDITHKLSHFSEEELA